MIVIPSLRRFENHRFYRDSEDGSLIHVDVLAPSPVHGDEALQWIPLAKNRAYLTTEVRFGPGEEILRQVGEPESGLRKVAVQWETGPVYAWAREEDGVRLLASGKTSGYGAHNAVLNATAPAEVVAAPVIIAAELSYRGRLAGAGIRGWGNPEVIREALARVPIGSRAPWSSSLAEVLVFMLRNLIDKNAITLVVESLDLSIDAIEELRDLAVIEWAYRIESACSTKLKSLAAPAAVIESLIPGDNLDMNIEWTAGDTIPVRAVRVFRPRGIVAPVVDINEPSKHSIAVSVNPDSDWSCFDYVKVTLRNGSSRTDVTLTEVEPACELRSCKIETSDLEAEASGSVRGFGVEIPIKDVTIARNTVTVRLLPVKERALLVRADREFLRQVGPMEVTLDHSALAGILVPGEGPLILSPESGDLPVVSAVYRALIRQGSEEELFVVTARFSHGIAESWRDQAEDGKIFISSARLPLLRVAVVPFSGSDSVTVELCQESTGAGLERTSLGSKKLRSGDLAVWVYSSGGGDLWMRSRYAGLHDEHYWTAWQSVEPDGVVLAPRVRVHRVAIMLTGKAGSSLEVHLAPAVGEGGSVKRTIAAGQVTTVELLGDEKERAVRYRIRSIYKSDRSKDSSWSEWTVVEGSVIKLNVESYSKGEEVC